MVLDIPGKLFGQSDVRETATDTGALTGTQYFSIAGSAFLPEADTFAWQTAGAIKINRNGGALNFSTSVSLPHGAVVTAVLVNGSDATNTWILWRATLEGATDEQMATANVDTEDTSISNAIINNSTHVYFLRVNLGDDDQVGGARITYTI